MNHFPHHHGVIPPKTELSHAVPWDRRFQELAAAFSPAFHVRLVGSQGQGLVFRQLQEMGWVGALGPVGRFKGSLESYW